MHADITLVHSTETFIHSHKQHTHSHSTYILTWDSKPATWKGHGIARWKHKNIKDISEASYLTTKEYTIKQNKNNQN